MVGSYIYVYIYIYIYIYVTSNQIGDQVNGHFACLRIIWGMAAMVTCH